MTAWLDRARSGDADAFAELVERYPNRAERYYLRGTIYAQPNCTFSGRLLNRGWELDKFLAIPPAVPYGTLPLPPALATDRIPQSRLS